MGLSSRRCKSCGGDLIEIGSQKFKCDSCGNIYYNEQQTDEERIALETAYNSLRQGNFEVADEAFDLIVKRFPRSYEAYWGALLSKNGVVYVDDVLENKKVPTCYNTILTSFLSDTLYKKALELAPKEIKENYIKQAEKIEKIREEWCEKASKEQPYDVFICFKDSDRENNIDRTRDSVDAAEIYHYLSKKYRVFFSRETLRGKVAEQYEPYIFNALKTAQVMIVFGSKAEYMNSTWVKNEWSRYIKRIKSGEKQSNSLVVAYKGMDAYDIPKQLSGGRQCIDARSLTFLTDLDSHIEKVLDVSSAKSKIERVKIESVAVGKKISAVEVQKIATREFGNISLNSLTATEEGALRLAEKMLEAKKYNEAAEIYERQYQQNSKNARAMLGLTYARCNVANIAEFSRLDTKILADNIDRFESAVAGLDEASAVQLLSSFSDGRLEVLSSNRDKKLAGNQFAHIFNVIVKFKFSKRLKYIQGNFEYAKKYGEVALFNSTLAAFQNPDPDFHIESLLSIARTIASTGYGSKITSLCDRVLAIDTNNARARWLKLLEKHAIGLARLSNDFAIKEGYQNNILNISISEIDDVLKYCDKHQYNQCIGVVVDNLCYGYNRSSDGTRALFDQIIKRITDKKQLVNSLTAFGNAVLKPIAQQFYEIMIENGKAAAVAECSFDNAKKYFALAVNEDETNIDARKGLLAAACKVASFEDITNSLYRISRLSEYQDLMIAAQVAGADDLLNELITLPDKQKTEEEILTPYYEEQRKQEEEQKKQEEWRELEKRWAREKRLSKFIRLIKLLLSAAVAVAAIITLFFFIPQEFKLAVGDVRLGIFITCIITALFAITYFIFTIAGVRRIEALLSAAVAIVAIVTLFFFIPQEFKLAVGDVRLGVFSTCIITALFAITYFIFVVKDEGRIERGGLINVLLTLGITIIMIAQVVFTFGSNMVEISVPGAMGVVTYVWWRVLRNRDTDINPKVTLIVAFCWIILQLVFLCTIGA